MNALVLERTDQVLDHLQAGCYVDPALKRLGGNFATAFSLPLFPARNNPIVRLVCNWPEEKPREKSSGEAASGRTLLYEIKISW
jgi:hypothetical protein